MPNPIRVGLVGYGYAGKTFHAPLIMAIAGLELAAIASRQAGRIAAERPGMAVHADPAALIARYDIDVVVIATPNATHAPLARLAILMGRHVVIDKPFALDLAEARELVLLAERRGVMLSVFHNRRWDSDFLTVRQAIEGGLIGAVSHFESHFDRFRPQVQDRWRERNEPGSGLWFDLGPHLVDQALQIFGLPDQVQVSLAAQRQGAIADDWIHAILFYGERRVLLHAGTLVAGGTNRFTVHGDAGSMAKRYGDPQEAQLVAGMRPGAPDWGIDDDPLIVFDAAGRVRHVTAATGDQRLYYARIRDALAGLAPTPVRPIEALAVMAVIEAGVASSRARAAMPLPLTDAEVSDWHDGGYQA